MAKIVLRLHRSNSDKIIDRLKLPELELIERIGFGAYGEVWLARSIVTGAKRAVKIVSRGAFLDESPFRREFDGIVKFDAISRTHPSQLCLFQVGKNDDEGYFYYAMELADSISASGPYRARTLRADLENGRLPAAKALELSIRLAEGMGHLHANGLIHRDIKPSNIIFVNGRPKLADIGLVTDASDECSIVGTPGYLAPEGPGAVSADIYAFGKVLYEAVTGLDRREFPKLPEDIRSWEDAQAVFELNEIILKACAADSEARYENAASLLADLNALQRGSSIRRKRSGERFRAGFLRVGLAALMVVLVIKGSDFLRKGRVAAETQLLNGSALGPASTNMDANVWCDRGMLIIHADEYADFPTAYTNFHRAIDLDPNFARPYVGLLELLIREGMPGVKTQPNELRTTRDMLVKLGPELASSFCARSIFCFYYFDFPAAEKYSKEAVRRDPEYELGHTWYAFMLHCWERSAESREQIKISQRIRPSKSIVYRVWGHTYYADRDFTNAIRMYEKTLEMEPHHTVALNSMGDAYRAQGMYLWALTNYQRAQVIEHADTPDKKKHFDRLFKAVETEGEAGYWREEWAYSQARPKDWPDGYLYSQAIFQIHLGNTEYALDLLEKSLAEDERIGIQSPFICLLYEEHWDGIRENKRFKKLLERLGFPKVTNTQVGRKKLR